MRNIFIIISLLFFYTSCITSNDSDKIKFDSNKWINGNRQKRGDMIYSLIKDSLFINKSKDEVLTLLGKPDSNINEINYKYLVEKKLITKPFYFGARMFTYINICFDSTRSYVTDVRFHR